MGHLEGAFAICVAAWDESDVIAEMLERAVRDISYENYRIFVGVYDNDLATRAEIERLCAVNKTCANRIIIVPHPRDGPTTKADCLNSIYQHVIANDPWAKTRQVAGFVLHDAEDIIHPSELCVFNHLITKADVIQLPVLPLARPLWDLVGGHYLDDFAESHTKDMVVREALGSGMPSAGVGCAFSTEALASIAFMRGGRPFDTTSVTEDYDLALDLCAMGYRPMFVRLPTIEGRASFVATQEFFPNTFTAAVKQKSRWLLGIALDSWNRRGWRGPFAAQYMFWRDRKSLITSFTTMLGYLLLTSVLLLSIVTEGGLQTQIDKIAPRGGLVQTLMWVNLAFVANRLLFRFAFVYRSYGLRHALMTPLRIVMGNVINFCAAYRAAAIFHDAQTSGTQMPWGKTQHQIPPSRSTITQPGAR